MKNVAESFARMCLSRSRLP